MIEADDPLKVLQIAAQRQVAEEKMTEAISKAKRQLVFGGTKDSFFWYTLSLNLKVLPDWELDTAATNGTELKVNPDFFLDLPERQRLGVFVHEVAHNALQHHARLGPREPRRANVAMDLAANPLLYDAGFELPPCRLMPGEGSYQDIPRGASFEAIYPLLPSDPEGGGEPGQEQGNDPGGCGGVEKPGVGDEAACREQEAKWTVAVAQAAQIAKQRGALSAGLDRWVQEVLSPTVPWQQVLRDFVLQACKDETRWSPPNRRFAWQNLYLPGRSGEKLGDLVLAIDTSGSIGERELSAFAAEIQGIVEPFPCKITVLYHDSDICHVQTWEPSDGSLVLEPKGGGGTDHHPIFAWVDQQDDPPTCLVAFTDLQSSFPDHTPAYPVLWASTSKGMQGPWGRTVEVIV